MINSQGGDFRFKIHLHDNLRLVAALSLVLIAAAQATAATVPNTAGLTQTAAATVIKNAGFVVGAVTTLVGSTVTTGEVIGESPAAGKTVKRVRP
jgi:beta-lactam-binding protein with PASTA domain